MRERRRLAIDVAGQRVELIERQVSSFTEISDGSAWDFAPSEFFASDDRKLIPEGHGFFRAPLGVRYKLID